MTLPVGLGKVLAVIALVITLVLIVAGRMELLYTGLLFLLLELAMLV